MSKFNDMFHYGNFEKRIIITIVEYVLSVIIWIIIDQYMTYSLFDNAIAKENIRLVMFLAILMIVKIILNTAEGIFSCKLRHHLQRDFSNYARQDIFSKLIKSKIQFFDKSNLGELFELEINDSENYTKWQSINKFYSQSLNKYCNIIINKCKIKFIINNNLFDRIYCIDYIKQKNNLSNEKNKRFKYFNHKMGNRTNKRIGKYKITKN